MQGLLITKVTKVHEGNLENKAFVTLRVLGGSWFFGLPREPDPLPGRGCAEVVTMVDDPERPGAANIPEWLLFWMSGI